MVLDIFKNKNDLQTKMCIFKINLDELYIPESQIRLPFNNKKQFKKWVGNGDIYCTNKE